MSASDPSKSRHPQSQQIASRWTDKAFFLGNIEFSFGSYTTQSEEELSPARQMQLDEGTDSTQTSMKRRRDRMSCLSDTMWALLRPQAPGMEGQPCILETLKAHLGPPTIVVMSGWPSQPPRQQQAEAPAIRASPGFVSRRLDDKLSTPFNPYIINYESSRGFIVTKFTTYDGTSNLFDHIMHFKQLMTLDIGNDAMLCNVFLASLHDQAPS